MKPSDGAVNSIEMWPITVIDLPTDHPLISHLQQTNPLATIPRLIDHQNSILSIQFLAQLFCHQSKTTQQLFRIEFEEILVISHTCTTLKK